MAKKKVTATEPAVEKKSAAKAAPKAGMVKIPPLELDRIDIEVVGDTSLICHKWSEKARKQMLGKQTGEARQGKERKNPEQDFKDSLYLYPGGGYGFPSVAFKAAAVRAAKSADMAMTDARAAFHVIGEMVKINGEPEMREDPVRLNGSTADIRFRGEFKKWSAVIPVRFNSRIISASQVVNLFNTAGFAPGVGEWRPEKGGQHGMFHVREG